MNQHRRHNVERIHAAFKAHALWREQLRFPHATTDLDPCWFGLPFLVDDKLAVNYQKLVRELLQRGIDTRPIVSGNMAIQPAIRLYPIDLSLAPFDGAQVIHDHGFFIGCHAKPLDKGRIERLVDNVLTAVDDCI
jgi:hypothetical protein